MGYMILIQEERYNLFLKVVISATTNLTVDISFLKRNILEIT